MTKKWGDLGGPSGKMHKFSGSGPQKPGGTSQEGTGGRRDQKAKAGGKEAFVSSGASNTSYAGTQTPGQTSSHPTGGDSKFASGGSNKMFGNRGSQKAIAGQSSQ